MAGRFQHTEDGHPKHGARTIRHVSENSKNRDMQYMKRVNAHDYSKRDYYLEKVLELGSPWIPSIFSIEIPLSRIYFGSLKK